MNLPLSSLGFLCAGQCYTNFDPKQDHSSLKLKGVELDKFFNVRLQEEIDIHTGLETVGWCLWRIPFLVHIPWKITAGRNCSSISTGLCRVRSVASELGSASTWWPWKNVGNELRALMGGGLGPWRCQEKQSRERSWEPLIRGFQLWFQSIVPEIFCWWFTGLGHFG